MLAQALGSTAAGLMLTIASVTALELSGSERVAGSVQTMAVVGSALLIVPATRLASRVGRARAVSCAYSVAALGSLLGAAAVVSGHWALLLGAASIIGAGTVAGLSARFAAADVAEGRATATAIALVLWASTAGSVLGPNLAGTTGSGSAGSFVLLAVLYAGAALLALPAARPPAVRVVGSSSARSSLRRTVLIFRAHPEAVTGLVTTGTVHMVMVALMALAPVHLHHTSQPAAAIGLLMSVHLGSMYAFSPLFGWVVSRWGAARSGSAAVATMLAAAGVLAISADGSPFSFAAGLALLGLGWSLGMIAGSTAVTEAVGREQRSATQGATDLLITLGGGLASLAAGSIVAASDYRTLAGSAAGIVALVIVVLLLRGSRPSGG